MTTAVPTLVQQTADLLSELNEVLKRHSVGEGFALLYAPRELPVGAGTVLVQEVDAIRGVVELRPRDLAEIASSDVLHNTQAISLGDDALSHYAYGVKGRSCLMLDRDHYYQEYDEVTPSATTPTAGTHNHNHQ
ncbi:hypothetical protein [Streptomyces sp. NPDC005423]|uniref:hypothetical protein n=1 Tax=Streptomyces sp. NPDC005423 TaxID=3155343 RepID=UPI0033A17C98